MELKSLLLTPTERMGLLEKEVESPKEENESMKEEVKSLKEKVESLNERVESLKEEIESSKTSRTAEIQSLKRKHAEELLALEVNYEKEIRLNKKKKWVNKLEFLNKICNECLLLSI